MKIFVYDEKTGGVIEEFCRSAGHEVVTHTDLVERRRVPARSHFFLDTIDALIMDITKPNQDIQFILAQSILAEKPSLCVYGKNQTPTSLIRYIKKPQTQRRTVRTFSYTKKSLPRGLAYFIRLHDPNAAEREDAATIKFTLRLTPHIEQYLNWLAAAEGESKADCIRHLLEQQVKEDNTYAKYLGGE